MEKKYKYGRENDLSIMQQYDSNLFMDKTKYEQIKCFDNGILEAINRIETMERKPKGFNVKEFYNVMNKLLNEYEENNGVRANGV